MNNPDSLYREAAACSARGDKTRAAGMLEDAARTGHVAALYTLGTFLLDGVAGERDPARALACFREAHQRGNGPAGHAAIVLEASGIGLSQPDSGAAMARLAALAEAGDVPALRCSAVIAALEGRGDQARALARSALDAGDQMMRALMSHIDSAPLDRLMPAPRYEQLTEIGDIRRWPRILPPILADYLSLKAAPLLRTSRVFDPTTGLTRADPARTSRTAILHPLDQDAVTALIDRRIAEAAGIAPDRGEMLSVLCYAPGEEYRPHLDAFEPDGGVGSHELARAGQRVKTFLVLLQDGFSGGETDFPRLSLRVRMNRGDGLSFRTVLDTGEADPRLLHAGLPVETGHKWLASKWFRARPIDLA